MLPLPLPDLTLPFPSLENPVASSLAQHGLAWVQRMGLIRRERTLRRYEAGKFWYLVAHCFPYGDAEVLPVILEWDSWAFFFDDISEMGQEHRQPEEMRRLVDDLLRVFDDEQVRVQPIFASLKDVWEHMQRWATPAWRSRFRASVAQTFESLVWEAENRQANRLPDQESYRYWRRASSGFATHIDLADFSDKISLSDEIRTSSEVQQLTDHANNIISWTNDIFSLNKELAQQDVHNLVLIVAHEEDLSLPSALQLVHAQIMEELAKYLDLKTHLPFYPPDIATNMHAYLQVLESWMCGNLDWSRETQRYLVPSQQPIGDQLMVWSSLHEVDEESPSLSSATKMSRHSQNWIDRLIRLSRRR